MMLDAVMILVLSILSKVTLAMTSVNMYCVGTVIVYTLNKFISMRLGSGLVISSHKLFVSKLEKS